MKEDLQGSSIVLGYGTKDRSTFTHRSPYKLVFKRIVYNLHFTRDLSVPQLIRALPSSNLTQAAPELFLGEMHH